MSIVENSPRIPLNANNRGGEIADNDSMFEFQSEYSMDPDIEKQMHAENDNDDFIPKQPVIDHLEKIKQRNKEKINKYKKFALDLK